MATVTPEQIQRMIDQLNPADQARLLEYLTQRVARPSPLLSPAGTSGEPATADAWSHFFCIGDTIAALDTPDAETLTAAVTRGRR